jgi:hypothetical protein
VIIPDGETEATAELPLDHENWTPEMAVPRWFQAVAEPCTALPTMMLDDGAVAVTVATGSASITLLHPASEKLAASKHPSGWKGR